MKTVTIELTGRGYKLKDLEDIKSREDCIWLMLAVRHLEMRALEIGYLPELLEGLNAKDKAIEELEK